MKTFFLQVCPDRIHVRNVEDQPPPARHRAALFQIKDGPFFVFSAERRKTVIFPAVDDFHPEHISVEPHGKSVVIKGELSCSEDLYIDGQVEGTINPKGNRLTIGPNGRVKANVNASAVVVQGKLEGNIQASDRVDLKQSAVVTGDIATQRISIDEGAFFKGGVNIEKEAPKKEVLGATALSSK